MEENNIVDVSENIKNEIKSNDVVLFMKGTPGFSNVWFFSCYCASFIRYWC
jgi:glutaredoxin-related protein